MKKGGERRPPIHSRTCADAPELGAQSTNSVSRRVGEAIRAVVGQLDTSASFLGAPGRYRVAATVDVALQ